MDVGQGFHALNSKIFTPPSPTVEQTPQVHEKQEVLPAWSPHAVTPHPSPSTTFSHGINNSVLGKINLCRFSCAAAINQNERKIS